MQSNLETLRLPKVPQRCSPSVSAGRPLVHEAQRGRIEPSNFSGVS